MCINTGAPGRHGGRFKPEAYPSGEGPKKPYLFSSLLGLFGGCLEWNCVHPAQRLLFDSGSTLALPSYREGDLNAGVCDMPTPGCSC